WLCKARCLTGRTFEMPIAKSASSPCCEDLFFSVFGNLEQDLVGLRISGNGAQRHFEYLVFPVSARFQSACTRKAVFGNHMFTVFEVQQRPQLAVSAQNN